MSEAGVAMAEQSTSSSMPSYTNSINFYEKMSHLQGELQGYESAQYQLQQEFQRLCTQDPLPPPPISLPSSIYQAPNSPLLHPAMTTTTGTSQSQNAATTTTTTKSPASTIFASHPNNNLVYRWNDEDNLEIRRRARNQEILDKLQQLQTNSADYAARSERLKIMKAEYEALVRKYSSNRKWISGSSGSSVLSQPVDGNESGNGGGYAGGGSGGLSVKNFTSTGVNTDISGPIKAISLPTDMLLQLKRSSEEIEGSGRLKGSNEGLKSRIRESSHDSLRDIEERASQAGRKRTLPTFLDISSTSESDLQGSLHLRGGPVIPHVFDDTSIDTTSHSVIVPNPVKSRGSNYNTALNLSDASLSESVSSQVYKPTQPKPAAAAQKVQNQNPKREKPIKSKPNSTGSSAEIPLDTIVKRTKSIPTFTSTPAREINASSLMMMITDDDELDGSLSSAISKTDYGLDNSILDSVQNKTPESLPRDDSELLHITEVDEEDEEEEYDRSELRNDSSVGLTYSGHRDGNDDNEDLGESDTEKLKEARKEIGTWRFQKDGDKRLGNVEPEFSWANKFAASASKLEILKSEKSSTNLADNNRNKKTVSEPYNAEAGQQNTLEVASSDEGATSEEMAGGKGEDQQGTTTEFDRNKEKGKNLEIERDVVIMTVPTTTANNNNNKEEVDGANKTGKDTEKASNGRGDLIDGGGGGRVESSKSFMDVSSKHKNAGGSAGNESKKKVRLQIDYDDSESSEVSSSAAVPAPGTKAAPSKLDLFSGSANKKPGDDEFDDFFD